MNKNELIERSERITLRIRAQLQRAPRKKPALDKLEMDIISLSDAHGRYAFSLLDQMVPLQGSLLALVIKGDVTGQLTIDQKWLKRVAKKMDATRIPYALIIDGNLDIDGDILDRRRSEISVFVRGNVCCDYLHSRDGRIEVSGDLRTVFGVCGQRNAGALKVGGQLVAPYIVAGDHDMPRVAADDFIYLEALEGSEEVAIGKDRNGSHGWGWNYFAGSKKLLSDAVWDEQGELDLDAFFDRVRQGENPLKAPAGRQQEASPA